MPNFINFCIFTNFILLLKTTIKRKISTGSKAGYSFMLFIISPFNSAIILLCIPQVGHSTLKTAFIKQGNWCASIQEIIFNKMPFINWYLHYCFSYKETYSTEYFLAFIYNVQTRRFNIQ